MSELPSTAMTTMKAVHIKEFVKSVDELKVTTIPIPTPPRRIKEPHYLVKITHTSPTHVDTLYARGLHQNNNRQKGHVHPPFTLGTEFSGIIIKIFEPDATTSVSNPSAPPSQTTPLTPGTKVWGMALGTFASYAITSHSAIRPLPPTLSLAAAAGLGAGTAPVSYGALARIAKLQANETILIHAAASGLGVAAVQIALTMGANVIATVGSAEKATAIHRVMLAHHHHPNHTSNIPTDEGETLITTNLPPSNAVIRYDTEPNWHHLINHKITGGKGVNVVFDPVGLVTQSIKCCAFNARVVIIGFVGRSGQAGPSTELENVPVNRILLKQIQLLGYRFGESARRIPGESEAVWSGFEGFLSGDGQGKGKEDGMRVRPVVHETYRGLHGVKDALGSLSRREVIGKVVVDLVADDDDDDDDDDDKYSETRSKL